MDVTVGGLPTAPQGCVVRVSFEPAIEEGTMMFLLLRVVLRRGINAPLYRLIGAVSAIPPTALTNPAVGGVARILAHMTHTLPQEVVVLIFDFYVPRHSARTNSNTPATNCNAGFNCWRVRGAETAEAAEGVVTSRSMQCMQLSTYACSPALLGIPKRFLEPVEDFILGNGLPPATSPYTFDTRTARLSSLVIGSHDNSVYRNKTISLREKSSDRSNTNIIHHAFGEAVSSQSLVGYELLAGFRKRDFNTTYSVTLTLPDELSGPLLIVHSGCSLTIDQVQSAGYHEIASLVGNGTAEIDGDVLTSVTTQGPLSWLWLVPKDPKHIKIDCLTAGALGFAMRVLTPQGWRSWLSGPPASLANSLTPGGSAPAELPVPAFHALAGFNAPSCKIGALSATPHFTDGSRGPAIAGAVGHPFNAAALAGDRQPNEMCGVLLRISDLELKCDFESLRNVARFSLCGLYNFHPTAAMCRTVFDNDTTSTPNAAVTVTSPNEMDVVSQNFRKIDRDSQSVSMGVPVIPPPPDGPTGCLKEELLVKEAEFLRFKPDRKVGGRKGFSPPPLGTTVDVWMRTKQTPTQTLRIKSLSILFATDGGLEAAFGGLLDSE